MSAPGLPRCDLCGAEAWKRIFRLGPNVILPGTLYRCCNCGLTVKLPLPTMTQLSELYGGDYAMHPHFKTSRLVQLEQSIALVQELLAKLPQNAAPPLRLLDIGAGLGEFLVAASRAGFDVTGVESCPVFAERLQSLGFSVIQDFLENTRLPRESFEVACLLEVLEHSSSPTAMLADVHSLLKEHGMLLMKVPLGNSLILTGARLLHRFGIERPATILYGEYHTYYFSPAVIERYLRQSGFLPLHRWLEPYDAKLSVVLNGIERAGVRVMNSIDGIVRGRFYLTVIAYKV